MALQRAKLADIQQIAAAAASIYANPATTKTYVRSLLLFNANTTAEIVKLYNVPASGGALGTAAAANQFAQLSLASLETLEVDFIYPLVLTATNDAIFAATTTAAKVTLQIMGDKE